MDFSGINGLSSLLQESSKKQEEAESQQRPVTVFETKVVNGASANVGSSSSKAPKVNKDIWSLDEVPTEDAISAIVKDGRPSPRYEINYKQSVGTEDTFLGMGDKTPGSADCTHLVVKVHFPGHVMKDLDLDVTRNRIKVESKTLRLFTYLPLPVFSEKGSAKFDTSSKVLTVTLPIDNEGMM